MASLSLRASGVTVSTGRRLSSCSHAAKRKSGVGNGSGRSGAASNSRPSHPTNTPPLNPAARLNWNWLGGVPFGVIVAPV